MLVFTKARSHTLANMDTTHHKFCLIGYYSDIVITFVIITGISGWGISWYLNGLLIPKIELYRGFEYTFIVEGGDDPSNPARYHPFYITNNDRGGYLVKSEQERKVRAESSWQRVLQSSEMDPSPFNER